MAKTIKKNYNNILRQYREQKGYTQEELAEKIGISPRQVQRIEYNESETKIKTLRKYIEILEIEDKDIIKIIKNNKL